MIFLLLKAAVTRASSSSAMMKVTGSLQPSQKVRSVDSLESMGLVTINSSLVMVTAGWLDCPANMKISLFGFIAAVVIMA